MDVHLTQQSTRGLSEPQSVTNAPEGWEYQRSRREERISMDVLEQLRISLKRWREIFPKEDTWVQRKRGAPSLLVRVDFGLDADWDTPFIFEIDPIPQGLGVVSTLSDFNARRVKDACNCMPSFESLIVPGVKTDDELWLKRVSTTQARARSGGLYLIRRGKDALAMSNEFGECAVNPVVHDRDKSYGIAMGLWQEVRWIGGDCLDDPGHTEPQIEDGYVLKPTQGQGGYGLSIVHPEHARPKNRKKGDFVGPVRAESQVRKLGKMYRQKYVPSPELPHCPGQNVAFSMYFALTNRPSDESYQPVAGSWIANRSAIVCAGPESTFGPLHFDYKR